MSEIELSDTIQRIENWREWARTKRHYRVTPSLEGKYKAPLSSIWNALGAKQEVNILDAVVIEKCLTSLTFPKKCRELIKYAYITPHYKLEGLCRKVHIRPDVFKIELTLAINILHNRLKWVSV